MLYKASTGQIKDNAMVFANGTFYMFSMYHKENSDKFNNVHLATSKDGVHFEDKGCVIEDFPDFIWAMKIHKTSDGYYMNSGSFNKDGKQIVLKFWKSSDLIHWDYCPELEVESPDADNPKTRLDCMCALKHNGKYYGYATGQYGYLTSDDGCVWTPHKSNISYLPFPEYNPALGGFEIADFLKFDNKFYLFCGGFGHLGMQGYGVFVYESDSPDGPFAPLFPNYRINGTSRRWVNMWERFFEKDGKVLAHNYMYDGYSYEMGNVYLPPLKELIKTDKGLQLKWWDGNDALYGDFHSFYDELSAKSPHFSALYDDNKGKCNFSETVDLPKTNSAVIDLNLSLSENTFTEYSCGGIYLQENGTCGTAILFDTYGKCDICYVKDNQIQITEDTISFGSSSLYYLESGKTYSIRILCKKGMFEIYVNDLYLQTFNTTHFSDSPSLPITAIGAVSARKECTLSNIKIYKMNI